jgi:polysaccharide pyruvyl transferase WcaK-like protein
MIVIFSGHLINLGDALIALRQAKHFQSKGHSVAVFPWEDVQDSVRDDFTNSGIEVVPIRHKPLRALWLSLRSHVIFGGGHMVREQVSTFWLAFTALSFFLSRTTGHRVLIAGVGVSKVQHTVRSALYRLMLRFANAAYVRDPVSEQVLRELAPASTQKIHLGGDMAYIGGPLQNRPASGVCVVAPAVDKSEARGIDFEEILAVLTQLKSEGLQRVTLVPHDLRDDFDLQACHQIKAFLTGKIDAPIDVLAIDDVSSGLMSAYGEATWVITARLHGLILASLFGAKVFYTEASAKKLKYFAEFFGYKSASNTAAAGNNEELEQVANSLSNRAEMSIASL